MEFEVLAERILLDLRNVFKKDPLIDEFDIVPVRDSLYNRCPIVHVQHKIALESWCVRHVYLYAYSKFMNWKQHRSAIDSSTLLKWLNALLLINPDLESAWNARKELILTGSCIPKDELKFSAIVLSRKPKSPQVFAHRKWVLTHMFKNNVPACVANQVINHELSLCMLTAEKYSNNYYAWNHRIWAVQNLLHLCSNIIADELQDTEQWVSTHISDHSGFHYRQFLITSQFSPPSDSTAKTCLFHQGIMPSDHDCFSPKNVNKPVEYGSLLTKEMVLLSKLQSAYPGHETLWNHRRFIIHELINMPECAKLFFSLSTPSSSSQQTDSFGSKKYRLESSVQSNNQWQLKNEEHFLQQRVIKTNKGTWEWKLLTRHGTWLKNVAMCPIDLPQDLIM